MSAGSGWLVAPNGAPYFVGATQASCEVGTFFIFLGNRAQPSDHPAP
jgi:hypothetical protein